MTEIEELSLIKQLLSKHCLPVSPILEYAITTKEKQYLEELPKKMSLLLKEI